MSLFFILTPYNYNTTHELLTNLKEIGVELTYDYYDMLWGLLNAMNNELNGKDWNQFKIKLIDALVQDSDYNYSKSDRFEVIMGLVGIKAKAFEQLRRYGEEIDDNHL